MRWWKRLAAIVRYAWNLWRFSKMPFLIEILTDPEVAALQRQADVEGLPLEQWARNRLLSGVTAQVREQIHPHASSALAGALRAVDAVDLALGEDAPDPSGMSVEGGTTIFGMPPVRRPEAETHERMKGSGQGSGPLASTERVDGHPCRHLERRYLPNFGPNDCQGTCGSPQRGESVCSWPASSARNCAYFAGKVRPVPSPPALPRQG